MTFVFEEGEPISVGSPGDHDFVLAGGEQVTDTGESQVVFEAGTGLGAQGVIANGTQVGYYETNETMSSFLGLNESTNWGYQGALDAGVVDNVGAGNEHYCFIHHDTANDIWGVGYITNQDTSVIITFVNSGTFFNNPTDPDLFKEDESGSANFGVDGNGDATAELITGGDEGDAVAYSIPTGSNEMTVTQESSPDPEQDPAGLDFVGPDGRVFDSFPASIDVTISV